MPYFKNINNNVLFIHIPKTGGSSLELYFSKKYNIPLNYKSLYMFLPETEEIKINSSLQHMTYKTICKHKNDLKVCFDNIQIITIVRNPYERVISDLFYYKKININTTKQQVFNILQDYVLSKNLDNHPLPQHMFITNDDNSLIPNIHILHTETLNQDMFKLGYTDFNSHEMPNLVKVNYYTFLNNDSIRLINNFYHLDFTLFNYNKILI